ncbi:MAG: sulfocyanin-like copper-binding protein [Actinomycetota bacterium]
MNPVLRRYIAVPAFLLLLLGAACSSSNDDSNGSSSGSTGSSSSSTGSSGSASGAVGATEKDFAITLDSSSANAGSVSFDIQNQGPSTHEFVVFKTDLAPDALPTTDKGTVDEEAKGLEHIDEVEDIAAGSTQTLTTKLDPGSYVVICNLPGHYQQGMHAPLTVS